MKPVSKKKIVLTASKAANQIRTIESALSLDDVTDAELRRASHYAAIPTEALEVAASFLQQQGHRFRQYDASEAIRASQYEVSMNEVADAARQLADRIDRSILKNRFVAVPQTLSLYAALKAAKRTDGSVRDVVDKLAPLVSTLKRGRRRRAAAVSPQPAAPVDPKPVTGAQPSAPVTNRATTSVGASTNGVAHS